MLRSHVRNQIMQEYRKQYMIELQVNMKSFCKNYWQMYYSGHFGRSLQFIRAKAMVASINFQVPIPSAKNHKLEFQAMTQNDLAKGLGISHWKVAHSYDLSPVSNMKVRT